MITVPVCQTIGSRFPYPDLALSKLQATISDAIGRGERVRLDCTGFTVTRDFVKDILCPLLEEYVPDDVYTAIIPVGVDEVGLSLMVRVLRDYEIVYVPSSHRSSRGITAGAIQ
jgi:hypothetical protein